jgi:hypothetical protein
MEHGALLKTRANDVATLVGRLSALAFFICSVVGGKSSSHVARAVQPRARNLRLARISVPDDGQTLTSFCAFTAMKIYMKIMT